MRLKPALFLLSLCYAGSAAGLGLGELTVHSALGQPLHASIRIIDPESHTVDCYRAQPADGAVSAPVQPQLALERAGSDALLHLRTRQSVADPILQLVLGFDCGPVLQREYVILLDPPSQVQAPVVVAPAPPPVPPATPAAAPSKPPARPAVERPRVPRSTPPGATPRSAATRSEVPARDDSPRLVLSGRRMASQHDAPFALKLDTNLLDLDRTPPPLTETELSDENTALTRKLAHLETQLVELQRRNAELESRRPATPAAPPPAPAAKATWPVALLGLGLLLALAVLVAWLRRRSRAQASTHMLQDEWNVSSTMPAYEEEEPQLAPVAATPAPNPASESARMPEIPRPLQEETTEVKDDILDQAEVYMAHGHSDLAIHLLQEHLREAPTESPVPWLLLLDLLQRDGDLAGYAAACAECRRHFNVNLADHPAANQADTGEGLEAYPHLLDRLTEVWRAPDVDAFFNDLIYDHRGGTRMGFSPAAYREILLLRAIAQDVRAVS